MSAITGLDDALAGKQPVGDYLTEEQDPTVPDWAKQPQKPAYTAQEVGALPVTTHIPTALSEMTDDATHRVVTDAEKATWNAKSNFTGSYNDLTDKPVIPTVPVQSVNGKTGAVVLSADDVGALPASTVIPEPYTLPIASETTLGGVKPVAKTAEMTQSVGVDEAGALFTKAGSGGGSGGFEDTVLFEITTEEEVSQIDSDKLDVLGNTDRFDDDLIFLQANIVPPSNESYTSNGKLLRLSIFSTGGYPEVNLLPVNTANIVPKNRAGYNGYVNLLLLPPTEISDVRRELGAYKTGQYAITQVNTEIRFIKSDYPAFFKLYFSVSTDTAFGVGTTLKIVSRRYL